MKKRLDVLLVERGLATSREKAKAMIMAGEVLVDNEREDKAGSMFPEEVEIVLKGKPLPYVSRGGLKLEKAMKNFDLTLDGKVCMDVGASTGGFTDCMLQNGAVKVYSVDVGHGQLDWKLRNDPRVVCMERTNIRYVVTEDIEERPSFVSIDVSFISLTKVLLPVRNLMEENGEIAALIKPQFEAGREKVGKKVLSVIRLYTKKSLRWSFPMRKAFPSACAIWNFSDQRTGGKYRVSRSPCPAAGRRDRGRDQCRCRRRCKERTRYTG